MCPPLHCRPKGAASRRRDDRETTPKKCSPSPRERPRPKRNRRRARRGSRRFAEHTGAAARICRLQPFSPPPKDAVKVKKIPSQIPLTVQDSAPGAATAILPQTCDRNSTRRLPAFMSTGHSFQGTAVCSNGHFPAKLFDFRKDFLLVLYSLSSLEQNFTKRYPVLPLRRFYWKHTIIKIFLISSKCF